MGKRGFDSTIFGGNLTLFVLRVIFDASRHGNR
jgi:hypothetical protein